MIRSLECSAIEANTWLCEREEYQAEWGIEEERQMMESKNILSEAERQLHDPRFIRAHTGKQLRALSKGIESAKRAHWKKYHAKFGNALKEAERAITLLPSSKDRMYGPAYEENLALIQTMFGENSQAISTLARLLQTPYFGILCLRTPVTPALLRLDPLWDPLRSDPAFQKLCEEKQP